MGKGERSLILILLISLLLRREDSYILFFVALRPGERAADTRFPGLHERINGGALPRVSSALIFWL